MNHYERMSESIYVKNIKRKQKKVKIRKWVGGTSVALASVLAVTSLIGFLPHRYTAEKISVEKVYADTFSFSSEEMNALRIFSGKTFEKIKMEKNTLYSPVSLFLGLTLLANGSEGKTKEEILNLIGLSESEASKFASAIIDYCYKNESIQFSGSLWINDNFSVKKSFIDRNTEYFGSDVFKAPFNQSTANDINAWVNEATNGQIKKIVDKVSPDIVLYIMNALHLEGKWLSRFSGTEKDFFTVNGETKTVDTLKKTLHEYYDSGNAQAFVHSFGYGLKFMGILPNEENYTLNGEEIQSLLNGYTSSSHELTYNVHTTLPTFSYGNDLDLKETMKDLGVREMFLWQPANFSPISNEMLFVDSIEQYTKIDLDQNGIKASAVLNIGFGATAVQPPKKIVDIDIKLDRPFFYLIYATPEYNRQEEILPLFVGYVADPTK